MTIQEIRRCLIKFIEKSKFSKRKPVVYKPAKMYKDFIDIFGNNEILITEFVLVSQQIGFIEKMNEVQSFNLKRDDEFRILLQNLLRFITVIQNSEEHVLLFSSMLYSILHEYKDIEVIR